MSLKPARPLGWALLCVVGAALAWCVGSVEYSIHQYLSNLPTLVFLLTWPFLWRRLSNLSLVQVAVFCLLHILGTRWYYSCVPYDEWSQALFGFELNEVMGWERNHYDRLIHLVYGLLLTWPMAEFIMRGRVGVSRRSALFVAFLLVMATSAFYEIAEWTVAVIASPENAERYNGQQGDFFDAQKDMALAATGSLLVWISAIRGSSRDLQPVDRSDRRG